MGATSLALGTTHRTPPLTPSYSACTLWGARAVLNTPGCVRVAYWAPQ
ncbi:MAG: hypothetical protein AAGJ08_07075 [Cyanobacteria bacterium P01_H01_bin.35]